MQCVWKKSKWTAVLGTFLAASTAWSFTGRGASNSGSVQAGKPNSLAGDSLPHEPTLAPKENYYFGSGICQQCHAEAPDRKQQPPLTCRCTELTIWRERDKHKEAYKALQGERARKMGELLGVKGSIDEQKYCLTCHSAYVPDGAFFDASSFGPEVRHEEGVSCAICHGLHKEWVGAHAPSFPEDREKWRRRRGEEKQNEFGMTNLRDPATRAALCASCHVGNHAEGKVISHEMYAAGHPPLPGIEIATFSDQMQRHWQYGREKPDDVQKILKELNVTTDSFEETKAMLIGGLVTFRETMKLVEAEAVDSKLKWPQLAQFDCYACHHELELPSWRQKRGYIGKPGWLHGRSWPMVLVRLALRQMGQDDGTLTSRFSGLRGAYEAQPFGERAQIAAAAGDLAEWADRQADALARVKLDAAGAGNLLRFVAAMAQELTVDYDSARQMAWAFQTLYRDRAGVSRKDTSNLMNELKSLNLSLFWGEGRSELDSMGEGLHKRNDFNPQSFRDEMRRLAGTLDYVLPQPD